MSLTLRPKTSWATPEDWNEYRELITGLYWDEGKTLKEVKEFMHLQYGFDATDKMYKARFKQWGLSKNMKSRDEIEVVRHAATGRYASLPVIRGRQVGSKKLRSRLHQLTADLNPSTYSPSPTSPSPLFSRLASPDISKSSEDSVLAVIHFAIGRMQGDSFGLSSQDYDWNADVSMAMWQDIRLATGTYSSAQPSEPNFRLLNKTFEWYHSALDAAGPSLIWVSLLAVLMFAEIGQELSDAFIRHVSALCAIKLDPTHPISRLWSNVRSMPTRQFKEVVPTILEAYFSNIRSSIRTGEEIRRVSILHAARYLRLVGAISFESAAKAFQQVTEELRINLKEGHNELWYWFARYLYCEVLREYGKYDEAYNAMAAVGLYIHRGHPDFALDKLVGGMFDQSYYTLKANILEALGRVDEATSYYIGAYTIIKRRATVNNKFRLALTSSNLETHYRKKGDKSLAGQVRVEAEAHWDALVGEELNRVPTVLGNLKFQGELYDGIKPGI